MKKTKFQQQKQQTGGKNYFDEDNDFDLQEEQLFNTEVVLGCNKPSLTKNISRASMCYITISLLNTRSSKRTMKSPQARLTTSNSYRSTIPSTNRILVNHPHNYVKGLMDILSSENKLFNKICTSFVFIDREVNIIHETLLLKFFDPLSIYGELPDLHHQDYKLKEGEAESMISRILPIFKQIYDIFKKLFLYIQHTLNSLNLIYNKKDPLYKEKFKKFDMFFPINIIGKILSLIYIFDQIIEQNDYIQQHWDFYKKMMRLLRADTTKTSDSKFRQLEKLLIRLDKTVMSGTCLATILSLDFNSKESHIPPMKNNKELKELFISFVKDRIEQLSKSKNILVKEMVLPSLCVYALLQKVFGEERKLWKKLWAVQKKIPFIQGHSQILCYVSKFLLEVTPLSRKSLTMEPRDPVAFMSTFLSKVSQNYSNMTDGHYKQFDNWIIKMQSQLFNDDAFEDANSKDLVDERFSQRMEALMSGLEMADEIQSQLQYLLLGTLGMEDQQLDKEAIRGVVLAIQMIKMIEQQLKDKNLGLQLIQQSIQNSILKIFSGALGKLKKDPKGFGSGSAELIASLQIISTLLKTPLNPMKLQTLNCCLDFARLAFKETELAQLEQLIPNVTLISQFSIYLKRATSTSFIYWCKDLFNLFFQTVYKNPLSAKRLQLLFNGISATSHYVKSCKHLENNQFLFESYGRLIHGQFKVEYLQPLVQSIEDYLRMTIHSVLLEKIEPMSPFKTPQKDIQRLLRIDNLLLFGSILNIPNEVTKIFDESFYNINVLNMYDMETYEQMRTLANFQFNLSLINTYLPQQTIHQGTFDILNILKNLQGFLNKYSYNMFTQTFLQIPTESVQIFTIGISQISDSIKTHGLGILNTNVNSVYQFIKKKLAVFSQFLFDELVSQPLWREHRWFSENKEKVDGKYPFERAESLYKEIKKMGVFEDGRNFMDKFRILVTQVGNALGFAQLLRSASLNFCSSSIEFLPSALELDQELYQRVSDQKFSDQTNQSAQELDDVFKMLKRNFSDQSDFLTMMVTGFESVNSKENKHLELFYYIIPALTLNFVEHMLISKEKVMKKNPQDCNISDDGFMLGLQYFLHLLKQTVKFDSLQWRKEVRAKLKKDLEGAKSLVQQGVNQSQRVAEEINMQKELSQRKLNQQSDEFNMIFYAFHSSKILFMK